VKPLSETAATVTVNVKQDGEITIKANLPRVIVLNLLAQAIELITSEVANEEIAGDARVAEEANIVE
jgi:antitoxin component of MazEF toxin-antitoxin module